MTAIESSYSNLFKLYGNTSRLYLDYLEELSCFDSIEDAQSVLNELLKNPRQLNQQSLDILSSYSQPKDEAVSKKVQQARTIARISLQVGGYENLEEMGVYPVLYGSLQYDDPKNCDADIILISEKADLRKVNKYIVYDIQDALIKFWDMYDMGTEPHLDTFSLEAVENATLKRGFAEKYDCDVFPLGAAITGLPLFSRHREEVALLQTKFKEAAESDPLKCALTNHHLSDCKNIRLERRGLL